MIIVASVSCIYGLGSPEAYYGMLLPLELGQRIDRDQILRKLVEIQYERNDVEFGRGAFRVRGDIVEVVPSYEEHALRIGLFGDEVDELAWFDPLTGGCCGGSTRWRSTRSRTRDVARSHGSRGDDQGGAEWRRIPESEGSPRQRLHQRTMFDLEMIREIGYCQARELRPAS